MSSSFKHYDSISYSDYCKSVDKLNKKKTQATKILENYSKKRTSNFLNKFLLCFFSGLVGSILQNIFNMYFEHFMGKLGLKQSKIEIEIDSN